MTMIKNNNTGIGNISKTALNDLLKKVAKQGRLGDNTLREVNGEVSHVNPLEALIIDKHGKEGEKFVSKIGSGTINPKTGMKEYIEPITIFAILLNAIAGARTWGGKDWNPFTRQLQGRHRQMTEGIDAPTTFSDIKDFYGRKGQYSKLKGEDLGSMIKALRWKSGGYGDTEMEGSAWNQALGGPMAALREFNPMKMLKEKMSPIASQEESRFKQGVGELRTQLAKLPGREAGGPSVGKTDLFGIGATAQGALQKMKDKRLEEQRKLAETDVASTFASLWG